MMSSAGHSTEPEPRPAGLPTVADCRLAPAGVDWDVVRVPMSVGTRALEILGPRSGAIAEDPMASALYWFVRRGTSPQWDAPHTRVLGTQQYVVVPPRQRVDGPGPHWRISPADRDLITNAAALHAAVREASRNG
jgi:hypothetical protein